MPEPLLAVSDLRVSYRTGRQQKDVLRDVSLSVERGQTVGLVGESGSGKSTLGRAVLGLVRARQGTIEFDGRDLVGLSASERRRMAGDLQVIFQDPYSSLNPAMTIRDILTEPLLAKRVGKREARSRVSSLLDRVAMPRTTLERYAREFSGGQRQRIAIARALALEPKLIVCDEPVSALDLSTQRRVLDLLHEVQRDTGVGYLFISHDLAVVRHMCDQVSVMLEGEIIESGPADTIINAPSHPYTQRLVDANLVADPAEQKRRRLRRWAHAGIDELQHAPERRADHV